MAVLDGCSSSDSGGRSAACPSAASADPREADRLACKFSSGSLATTTVNTTEAARQKIPIEHVVVVMKENRSYDHIFGALSKSHPDAEAVPPTFSNKDAAGNDVKPFHSATTCIPTDPGHQWVDMHNQVNGGAMDGFVTNAASTAFPGPSDGHFVMGYYDETDLPFYYFLAKTYALADRHFPSVLAGTFPNRDYLYLGTSDGVKYTFGIPTGPAYPDASLPTIFTVLTAAGVSWGEYADNGPLSDTLGWSTTSPGVHPVQDLIDGFASGNLPSVVFVDGSETGGATGEQDEHPPGDLQVGEAWTKRIYDAAIASSLWDRTVLFFTYDEGGGFADHVPPPTDGCIARPGNATDAEFFELGVRVPLIAISPWARRHFVSHVRHEHTSITRFIELVFNLGAMTARDANSDALLDMFDFGCGNSESIPTAPAAGTGDCTP